MSENDNRRIAKNSLYLYTKIVVSGICSFISVRFALLALGEADYGLSNLVGGLVVFMSVVNTVMVSTSTRFITVEVGRRDIQAANIQFNACLLIHLVVAVLTCLIAIEIGEWYIINKLNYEGDIGLAVLVFRISLVASVLSFLSVPYNGLLMAKERFAIICSVDIMISLVRLVVCVLLVYYFENKLVVYTLTQGFTIVLPLVVYALYCHSVYNDITKLSFVKDIMVYLRVISFSTWVAIGAVSIIVRNQGTAIIVNAFFSTVANAALAVSYSVSHFVSLFSQNISKPIAPQIVKNYVSKNHERCVDLMVMSSKYGFSALFLMSTPLLVQPEWVLGLWLETVPPLAPTLLALLIILELISAANMGVSEVVFAKGNIKSFQIWTSTLRLMSVVCAYYVMHTGFEIYAMFIVYIAFDIVIFIVRQWILVKTIEFDNSRLIFEVYVPCIIAILLLLPCFVAGKHIESVYYVLCCLLYSFCLIYFIILNKKDKTAIYELLIKINKHR